MQMLPTRMWMRWMPRDSAFLQERKLRASERFSLSLFLSQHVRVCVYIPTSRSHKAGGAKVLSLSLALSLSLFAGKKDWSTKVLSLSLFLSLSLSPSLSLSLCLSLTLSLSLSLSLSVSLCLSCLQERKLLLSRYSYMCKCKKLNVFHNERKGESCILIIFCLRAR